MNCFINIIFKRSPIVSEKDCQQIQKNSYEYHIFIIQKQNCYLRPYFNHFLEFIFQQLLIGLDQIRSIFELILSSKQNNKIIQMQNNTIENTTPSKQPSNPEFATPQSIKKASQCSNYDEQHFQELRTMLHQDRILDAINLFAPTSFIRQLITDHIEVNKIHEILMSQAGTIGFENIKYDVKILGVEREARLKGLQQLKRSKCLNNALVNNVSNHLQDILLEQFEPLTSFSTSRSQIFIKLYQKLNQIQQKFDIFKTNSTEVPTFIRQKAQQVSKQNRKLQQQLDRTQQNVGKYQHEASRMIKENSILKQSIKSLRTSQNKHEIEKLQLQKELNAQLERKEQKYKEEILELKNHINVPQRIRLMEKDLDASIQDFKNLIYKLSVENRLLKEEKDLLLAQLAKVYEKFQVFVTFYETASACERIQMPPLSIDDEQEKYQQQQSQDNKVSDLMGKLDQLQVEIKEKNDIIRNIKNQLEDLRREKENPNNSALDRSISINSAQSSEQKRQGRRYKRTKSGEEAVCKVTQLEELRKLDKELIDSLSVTVEELTEKIKTHLSINGQSDANKKKLEPQETSNTISSQAQYGEAKPQESSNSAILSKTNDQQHEQMAKNIQKMKQKIHALEINLDEERQTNASLSAILEDLHSFEKPKEESSVLTPRMLTEIAELKDSISSLTEKGKDLEKDLAQANSQKAELIRIYQDQVINLEFQCSGAQLQITTLENKIYDMEFKLIEKQKESRRLLQNQVKEPISKVEDVNILLQKQKLQEQLNAKIQEIEALLAAQQSHKLQLEEISSKLKSSQMMLNYTKNKNKQLEKKYKSIVTVKQFRDQYPNEVQHALFFGDILQEKPFEKQFLVESLQKRTGKTIRRSKLLWKYDALNKVNLHQYIDNNENFVMLVELEDGYVVGGYSQGKIFPKMVSDKDGILFSLTKKEVFQPVQPNKRVVVYDDYYIIFGNSELRVKSQQCKLFSNFGINSSFFKAKGLKVDIITNSTEKEVPFKNVEIHQLQFL